MRKESNEPESVPAVAVQQVVVPLYNEHQLEMWEGRPHYLHMANCPNYCDYACNGQRGFDVADRIAAERDLAASAERHNSGSPSAGHKTMSTTENAPGASVQPVVRRRRRCKLCRGLTHSLAMTAFGLCQACHGGIVSRLDSKWEAQRVYCGGCGMLKSQCDCWDPINQT